MDKLPPSYPDQQEALNVANDSAEAIREKICTLLGPRNQNNDTAHRLIGELFQPFIDVRSSNTDVLDTDLLIDLGIVVTQGAEAAKVFKNTTPELRQLLIDMLQLIHEKLELCEAQSTFYEDLIQSQLTSFIQGLKEMNTFTESTSNPRS